MSELETSLAKEGTGEDFFFFLLLFETRSHFKAWTGYTTILLPQSLSTGIVDVCQCSWPQVRLVYHSGQSSGMAGPGRSINPWNTKSWNHQGLEFPDWKRTTTRNDSAMRDLNCDRRHWT